MKDDPIIKKRVNTKDELYSKYPDAEDGWVCSVKEVPGSVFKYNSRDKKWIPYYLNILN